MVAEIYCKIVHRAVVFSRKKFPSYKMLKSGMGTGIFKKMLGMGTGMKNNVPGASWEGV